MGLFKGEEEKAEIHQIRRDKPGITINIEVIEVVIKIYVCETFWQDIWKFRGNGWFPSKIYIAKIYPRRKEGET